MNFREKKDIFLQRVGFSQGKIDNKNENEFVIYQAALLMRYINKVIK